MYIRQPSCSSRRASYRIEFNQEIIPLLPFLLLTCVFSPSLGNRPRNSCPRDLGRSLAFALSQSILPLSFFFSLSLSLSFSLSSLAWMALSLSQQQPVKTPLRMFQPHSDFLILKSKSPSTPRRGKFNSDEISTSGCF
ncbi:hypothetical protein F5888DRAFT_518017 [Russula emetica]|nr:hypothetical protein F5888DRAFT_518017 [Russula emetica]